MPTLAQTAEEWKAFGIGALIIGGQALVERGLREYTKDIDACVPAVQCARMLEWLRQKERQGHAVELRVSSAPLHPDWLANGWTTHVLIDGDKLDFFGVPMRAPQEVAERFLGNPAITVLASLREMGFLKRTGRLRDWGDIDLISRRLGESGEFDAMLQHLFGSSLVRLIESSREHPSLRAAIEKSLQARCRPILRLGLSGPHGELVAMAQAELSFWMLAGAERAREVTRTAAAFWRKHSADIRSESFSQTYERLQQLAAVELPRKPIADPIRLIEGARRASGVDRWPGLVLPTPELVLAYFPAYRTDPKMRHGAADGHGLKP